MIDKEDLIVKIKHFIPWILGQFGETGYKLMALDDRDFKFSSLNLGGIPYVPKKDFLSLSILSTKNQMRFNDCVYNATVGAKEPDEGIVLSVQSLVIYANRQNYISGNGFSDLRDGELSLKNFGCQEQSDFPGEQALINNNDWNGYVSAPINSVKAAVHKISSFWFVYTKDEILNLLDQGRRIKIAIPWYSGYNTGGRIVKTLGFYAGGHCMFIRGYQKTAPGQYDFIVHNSYGDVWGNQGDFTIESNFLITQINQNGFGAIVDLDVSSDIGKFLNQYDGQDVKGDNGPNIYHIQGGQKKLYPDMMTFLAWTGGNDKFNQLNDADTLALAKIPSGDNMDITKTVYWPVLQTLSFPDNLNKLLEILHQK